MFESDKDFLVLFLCVFFSLFFVFVLSTNAHGQSNIDNVAKPKLRKRHVKSKGNTERHVNHVKQDPNDVCLLTPLQKESQVRFEMPEEIPVGHEYMMQMLPENQKNKNSREGP